MTDNTALARDPDHADLLTIVIQLIEETGPDRV